MAGMKPKNSYNFLKIPSNLNDKKWGIFWEEGIERLKARINVPISANINNWTVSLLCTN